MSEGPQFQVHPDEAGFAVEPAVERAIEALLFVSDRPLTAPQIAKVLEEEAEQVERALESLREFYEERGIRILVHGDAYQMCSAPEAAAYCRRLLGMNSEGSSRPRSGCCQRTSASTLSTTPVAKDALGW